MKNEALPVQVVAQIPPGIDLPSPEVQGKFRKLATDTLNAANEALGLYRELVAFIRDNQLQPGYVRPVLKERGFVNARISEIIRVADGAQPDYDAFIKGDLTFKAALQLRRGVSVNVQQQVAAHRERESAKFKRELEDLLGLYIPLSGGLPKYLQLTLKGEVNGYPYTFKVGRTTKAGK